MTTLGWLGWRSIWAPPKGGEAATVPCNYKTYVAQKNNSRTPRYYLSFSRTICNEVVIGLDGY